MMNLTLSYIRTILSLARIQLKSLPWTIHKYQKASYLDMPRSRLRSRKPRETLTSPRFTRYGFRVVRSRSRSENLPFVSSVFRSVPPDGVSRPVLWFPVMWAESWYVVNRFSGGKERVSVLSARSVSRTSRSRILYPRGTATENCCSQARQDSLHRTCHAPHQPALLQPSRHA
jgi:hypothetical protein